MKNKQKQTKKQTKNDEEKRIRTHLHMIAMNELMCI